MSSLYFLIYFPNLPIPCPCLTGNSYCVPFYREMVLKEKTIDLKYERNLIGGGDFEIYSVAYI